MKRVSPAGRYFLINLGQTLFGVRIWLSRQRQIKNRVELRLELDNVARWDILAYDHPAILKVFEDPNKIS
jgi:hypothetical protein